MQVGALWEERGVVGAGVGSVVGVRWVCLEALPVPDIARPTEIQQ